MDELLMERYALAKERVCEIKEEKAVQMPYLDFFQKTAAFLEKNVEIMDGVVFLGETREPRKTESLILKKTEVLLKKMQSSRQRLSVTLPERSYLLMTPVWKSIT